MHALAAVEPASLPVLVAAAAVVGRREALPVLALAADPHRTGVIDAGSRARLAREHVLRKRVTCVHPLDGGCEEQQARQQDQLLPHSLHDTSSPCREMAVAGQHLTRLWETYARASREGALFYMGPSGYRFSSL